MKKQFFSILLFVVAVLVFAACNNKNNENSIIGDGAELIKIQSGFKFTEGPAVDKDGNIYFTDQPDNKIYKWNCLNESITVFHDSAERANGMYFDKDGNLIACADLYGKMISIKPDKSFKTLFDNYNGKRLNAPNDLWITPNGGIYFTDPYYQREYWERTESEMDGENVYYFSPGNDLKMVAAQFVKPNGIIGTPDGKILYVADIGDSKTYKFKINDDGSLSEMKLFCNEGSDGMTIDDRGNIYLTNKFVSVFNSAGEKIKEIQVPEQPSNVCFGGNDRSTLFITARTSVYKIKMNVSGV